MTPCRAATSSLAVGAHAARDLAACDLATDGKAIGPTKYKRLKSGIDPSAPRESSGNEVASLRTYVARSFAALHRHNQIRFN